jgi:DNA invertase Pin-like site-specific DNA recombinase
MTHPKILPTHLQRKAVVYVRQSTPHQVEQNLESRDCQYQLLERAQRLGWAAADCTWSQDMRHMWEALSRKRRARKLPCGKGSRRAV